MKNEFDNKLTDKGWQSMRRLLDREMPEQRSRRRFAWWWFVLLLLPLTMAGGWWLLQPSKPASVTPPVEKPKISEPVVKTEKESIQGETKPSGIPAVPAVVGVPANNKRRRSTSNEGRHTLRGDVGKDNNNSKNESRTETHNGDVNSMATVREKSAETSPSKDVGAAGELIPGETFQKLPTFGLLNPLPVSAQLIENEIKNTPKLSTVTPFTASITKKHPEPKRWSFGLSAGLASEKFSSINGFSAGTALDWQFARRWGVRSGLQYAQHRISGRSRPVVSLAALEYVNATGNQDVLLDNSGSPVTSPSTTPSTVAVPVERLRQLEMPMLAFWQPVRPLRIFGGLSMNYTFSAKASAESYANNTSYFADTKQAQNNLNELAASNLRHWQTNLQTGLGIRLGKHFELDAFYKYGIPDPKITSTDSGTFDPTTGGTAGEIIGQRKGATHNFLLNGILFF